MKRVIIWNTLYLRMELTKDNLVDQFEWSRSHNAYMVKTTNHKTKEVKWWLVEVRDAK